ncbi:MAG: YkgJ family cysteine cluster protein [Myxococcales bacterium]|nr:YkgJ family cysteine cluster protein [Myxococcales bacterium]
MSALPTRPVLLPHVLARRHVADGARLVVLHDTERLTHHRVSERTWAVLSAMDGTRDLEGLRAHAERQGFVATAAELADLLADLSANGLVGERGPSAETSHLEPTPDPSTPIRQLPGFRLSCDGSGSCCRFYPSIAFTPLDAARARTHQPRVLDGGMDEARVFLPMAGHARGMLAVTLVDGRCAFLEEDRACGIHRASRADQKPLGCRTYPARFVDDGDAIRVAPWLECACIFKSGAGAGDGGEPLVSEATQKRSDLDPAFFVESLPAEVLVSSTRRALRAEVVRWSDALIDAPLVADGVAALVALSAALERHGLDIPAARDALAAPPPPPVASFDAASVAFQPHIERFASETWRGQNDLVRATATALANAATLAGSLAEDLLAGPGTQADAERFYVRGLLFGHQLVQPKALRAMSLLAFDRAYRMLLGRSLAVVVSLAELRDPAFGWPIGLVDATMRGYGLSAYVRDLSLC